MRFCFSNLQLALLLTIACLTSHVTGQDDNAASDHGELDRVEWTTSQFIGSPEPPVPFLVERVFADVELGKTTEMIRLPKTDRWVVVQLDGKIVSFSKAADPAKRDFKLAVDLKLTADCSRAFGIAFHPQFPETPYCYVTYVGEPKSEEGTWLTRFTVSDPESLTIDPESRKILARWSSFDHMGGSPKFGHDGMLYFSVGDGQRPNPPDPKGTGQDISDLQCSILRIDVDGESETLPYKIPADNPFVNVPGARGEVWAFGLRNPWRIAFHPTRDELWVGDVGWEMQEMIYQIKRGSNYGWSVMEGSQVVKADAPRHEVPISPPIIEYDHTHGRSVTGGYFWHSDRIEELNDAYIYGDWTSGKLWAVKYRDDKITWQQELGKTQLQPICFAVDDDGEVLVVGFDGTIQRLIRNPAAVANEGANESFPRRLSQTGLFNSVVDQTPAPGVMPYSINAYHWADNTTSQQWFALEGDSQLGLISKSAYDLGKVQGYFDFPRGTVFAKTISYQTDVDDPDSNRRLETQILHRLDLDWRAYNYVWNDEQTDAILQDNISVTRKLEIKDPQAIGGVRKQEWLHASRDQCALCHIWRAGSVNGFRVEQLNRIHPGQAINQLDQLEQIGLVDQKLPRNKPAVGIFDTSAPIADRARRYLDLNCAHCHMPGGGGSAPFSLQAKVADDQMKLLGAEAMQGRFGIEGGKTLEPGHPSKSVLLYRIAKSGPGKMPKFGNNLVDEKGVKLIHDWIASMKPIDSDDNSDDTNTAAAEVAQLMSLAGDAPEFNSRLNELLEDTETALLISIWCSSQPAIDAKRQTVVNAAQGFRGEVRDLFEHFLPEDQRPKRLGPKIDAEKLLAMSGDAEQGKKLFFESSFTCRNCHQVGDQGKMVGPNLSGIGTQRSPAQLLRSLIEPSAEIEDKYRGILLVTIDGDIKSGLRLDPSLNGQVGDDQIGLVDLEGKTHVFENDDIEDTRNLDKSIMPEGLLEEFTAQQAANLLAYLKSLKSRENEQPDDLNNQR